MKVTYHLHMSIELRIYLESDVVNLNFTPNVLVEI
jgi:hypothetical protein